MDSFELGQIKRLGLDKREMRGGVGKHMAIHDAHLRSLIERLDSANDHVAADTIVWLIWHIELQSVLRSDALRKIDDLHNTKHKK